MNLFEAKLQAQDLVFSQFFPSQTYMNPALTGFFEGQIRANAGFRTQWGNIDQGFRSYLLNVDGKLFESQLKGDYFGVGFLATRDEQTKAITQHNLKLNLSFTKKLGSEESPHFLSIGFYAGPIERTLNRSLTAPEDPSEFSNTERNIATDFGFGLNYQVMFYEKANLYAGFSVDHLLPINLNATSGNTTSINRRMNAHLSIKYRTAPRIYVIPAAFASFQSNSYQVNPSLLGQFELNRNEWQRIVLTAGLQSRFTSQNIDAFTLISRIEYASFFLGMSYDINVSELNTKTGGAGSFETHIGYIGKISKKIKDVLPCPNYKSF